VLYSSLETRTIRLAHWNAVGGLVSARSCSQLKKLCPALQLRQYFFPLAVRMGKGSKRDQANGPGLAAGGGGGQSTQLEHYLCNVQVLAGDVDSTGPSLLLTLDKWGRLLFNAGEGIQRLIRENKLRTTNVCLGKWCV
jgi:hypothetical protein